MMSKHAATIKFALTSTRNVTVHASSGEEVAYLSGGREIDIVYTHSGPAHHLEAPPGCLEHFPRYLRPVHHTCQTLPTSTCRAQHARASRLREL